MTNATKKPGDWSAVRQQLVTWEKPALLALLKDLYEAAGGIGWIEEVPGVNCQERTRNELLSSLRTTLAEALELNRQEAIQAATPDYEEDSVLRAAYRENLGRADAIDSCPTCSIR